MFHHSRFVHDVSVSCEMMRRMQRDRTVFIKFLINKGFNIVASGVQLRNGFSGDAFSARWVVSLPRNSYETRIMLNQMLLLRRLNNYSSAEFSLTLKRFTFKTAECTCINVHAR